MARFTREYYTCDICGKEIKDRVQADRDTKVSIQVDEDYGVAGGSFILKDLCIPCNSIAKGLADHIRKTIKERKVNNVPS